MDKKVKSFKSPNYNYVFRYDNGFFARWGRTQEDDPEYSPFGPELADIELVSGGNCLGKCNYCYKCNNNISKKILLTFDQFKIIFNKLPLKVLTQIAFGITNIYANPDFFKILEYTRANDVVPNYTTHGLDLDDYAVEQTVKYCGAVAISVVDKESTYNAVKKFTDAGMKQVNIHYMLSSETYEDLWGVLEDIQMDPRLAKLNAIVFLHYKHKNKSSDNTPLLDVNNYSKLVYYLLDNEFSFGFDSCGAVKFENSLKGYSDQNKVQDLIKYIEPCESFGVFSSYISAEGFYYPCSFVEKVGDWSEGINLFEINNFLNDVWFSPKVNKWRKISLDMKRRCPFFKI